jgi:hypothetical protein
MKDRGEGREKKKRERERIAICGRKFFLIFPLPPSFAGPSSSIEMPCFALAHPLVNRMLMDEIETVSNQNAGENTSVAIQKRTHERERGRERK